MGKHGHYIATETTRELFQNLLYHSVDKEKMVRKAGIDLLQLEQPETRFPVRNHLNLWGVGEELCTNKAIGLSMGACSDPNLLGIVGLAFVSSKDLYTAIQNKVRYTKILADYISLEFIEHDGCFSLHYSILEEFFHHYEIERVFAGFLNWVRVFIGKKVYPTSMSFQYNRPHYSTFYKKHFDCPLYFNQAENIMTFSSNILTSKNSNYNDYLYRIIKDRADRVLDTLDRKEDFIVKVKGIVANKLSRGGFLAEDIAGLLNMSRRTFTRKLNEHSLTYQGILDDVRKEMAFSYLAADQYSLENIPGLLGYSDPSGFYRAFKRWAGRSPKQYIQGL